MDILQQDVEVVVNTSTDITASTDIDINKVDTLELDISFNDNEYSIVGDDMVVVTKYDDAPQWLKDTIGNIVNIKTAVAVGDLNTVKESLDVMLGELEVAKNTYQLSIISSDDINQRITTAITTLNSSLQAADATILNIANTAVTPSEASAIALNTLSASLSSNGEIGSAIHNLQTAMTTLQGTTATDISYLESAMQGEIEGNAQAMNTIRTYVGIDEAGASIGTGLSAYLEGSDGNFGSAGSKLNNDIKVTAEGIESKWAYNSSLNINGVNYNSGFGLATSLTSGSGLPTGTSEFWIKADKFRIMSADGSRKSAYSPFTVDSANGNITFNGVVSFNNVTDTTALTNSITTAQNIASAAQTTANSKISTYYTTSAPSSNLVTGDLWVNSSNNTMYRWNGTSWVTITVDVSSQLPQTLNSTVAPNSSNVYPKGTIWRQSVTVNGGTQYTHWLSYGSGVWANIGGTYIDGSNIVTGSINADKINVSNLFSQNITYTGTITGGTGGSGGLIKSYNGNMVIDLVNGSIYIA